MLYPIELRVQNRRYVTRGRRQKPLSEASARAQIDRAQPAHLPGQYVSVLVTLPDGRRQPRQYTVSAGARENSVQITVREGGGFRTDSGGVLSVTP